MNLPKINFTKPSKKTIIITVGVVVLSVLGYLSVKYIELVKAYARIVTSDEAQAIINNPNMPLFDPVDKEMERILAERSEQGSNIDAVRINGILYFGDAEKQIYIADNGDIYNAHSDTAVINTKVTNIDPLKVEFGTCDALGTFTKDAD